MQYNSSILLSAGQYTASEYRIEIHTPVSAGRVILYRVSWGVLQVNLSYLLPSVRVTNSSNQLLSEVGMTTLIFRAMVSA